ncbi:protein of unknown function [Cupriavidus taiwanensis]|nr:protein of unknown function [Cupriavidus taiwanensis]
MPGRAGRRLTGLNSQPDAAPYTGGKRRRNHAARHHPHQGSDAWKPSRSCSVPAPG